MHRLWLVENVMVLPTYLLSEMTDLRYHSQMVYLLDDFGLMLAVQLASDWLVSTLAFFLKNIWRVIILVILEG